jgi:hypothetical protein
MQPAMVEVAHLNSVGQHFRAATMNSIDVERIRCSGCSLHHQRIVGSIVRGVMRIYISWQCKQTNWLMGEAARQRATKGKMNILAHQ